MQDKVRAWTPPTKEHHAMKSFMLEQLAISKHDLGYAETELEQAIAKTPVKYCEEALEEARRSVVYHEKKLKAEMEWCATPKSVD